MADSRLKSFIRKRQRYPGYDYSLNGAYYITICTAAKKPLLGSLRNGVVKLNATGGLVAHNWQQISTYDDSIRLDAFIVMPNHLHGIVTLSGYLVAGQTSDRNHGSLSISSIIQRFKSLTGIEYSQSMLGRNPEGLAGKLWQRGFYDRILRDEDELQQKREYIITNPQRTLFTAQ